MNKSSEKLQVNETVKIYEQICQNIRFSDDISFKLLGLVPIFSGAGIVVTFLNGETVWKPGIFLISLFGAFVTLGLFRWELRNIRNCNNLIERAKELEADSAKQFKDKWEAPGLFDEKIRIGKTEAEKFIYTVTVIAWLTLPWITKPFENSSEAIVETTMFIYCFSTVFIGILLLFSLFAKTKNPKRMETIDANEQLNKVAQITLLFWLMKIIATTLGETLGDFFSMTLGLGYSIGIAITFAFFLVVLLTQLFLKKYVPAVYWLVIIGTTTLGTEISDFIDRSLGLGYALGSLLLVTGLLLTLLIWYKKYNSLEVFPIFEKQKEIFYWVAVLFSNSLGTAFGDFLSSNLELSYLTGAVICGAVILIVVLLHYYTKINHIVLFWIAFIFTRPFGATFGDLLTKPLESGGLELGTLPSSLISIALMIFLIFISHRQNKETLYKDSPTQV